MSDTTTTPATEADPLADLARQAEAIEGEAEAREAQQQAQQQQAEAQSMADELRQVLQGIRMMAAPAFTWWPDFGRCWSDQQLTAISTAGAAVMQRHGLTMGDLWAQWGPYIALAGATLPPSLATVAAIKARKALTEQRPAEPGPVRPAGPAEPDTAQQGIRQ